MAPRPSWAHHEEASEPDGNDQWLGTVWAGSGAEWFVGGDVDAFTALWAWDGS